MLVWNHRFNKFDVFVVVIAIVIITRFVVNATQADPGENMGYAVLTLIILTIYVKIAQFDGRL